MAGPWLGNDGGRPLAQTPKTSSLGGVEGGGGRGHGEASSHMPVQMMTSVSWSPVQGTE